jgi:hypothetical protein
MKQLTLLTLITILFVGCVPAQNKVGNLTLSDSIFNAYILDLYHYPDTVYVANESTDLLKLSVGSKKKIHYYNAYIDTIYDGLLGCSCDMAQVRKDYEKNKDYKTREINHVPAGSYQVGTYYYIPRKPSENDFIKWYKKHSK